MINSKDERRALVHLALSIDEAVALTFGSADRHFAEVETLAKGESFREFAANKLQSTRGCSN